MVHRFWTRSRARHLPFIAAAVVALTLAPATFAAEGEEAVEVVMEAPAEKMISLSASLDLNTHFVSYGLDVWGAGNTWWGNEAAGTFNPSAELAVDVGPVTLLVGTWWDVNDNAPSSIGGQLQEVDMWYGVAFDIGKLSVSVLYQDWMYGSQVERIVDVSFGYDDTGLIFEDFAFNPSLVVHTRVDDDLLGIDPGVVLVLGLAPEFQLIESEDFSLSLAIPMSLGIFLTDDFHGLDETGVGYFSIGAAFGIPLTFIDEAYGSWDLHFGVTWYLTDDDIIPNPTDNFLTGNIGIGVSF